MSNTRHRPRMRHACLRRHYNNNELHSNRAVPKPRFDAHHLSCSVPTVLHSGFSALENLQWIHCSCRWSNISKNDFPHDVEGRRNRWSSDLPNGSTFSRKPREPDVVNSLYRGARLDGCNVLLGRPGSRSSSRTPRPLCRAERDSAIRCKNSGWFSIR